MIQGEATKLTVTRGICRSYLAWVTNCIMVTKKDGPAKICQEHQRLNALLEPHSGGLGDIASIFDSMKGATCFTSIDLASNFTQLEIAEEDKHKAPFPDAHGEVWKFNCVRDAHGELWKFNCVAGD